MIVYDGQRRPVELGRGVGHGGEATVYQVAKQPDSLAKIYEPEPRANYAGKLAWMVSHPPENPTEKLGHPSLAWPGGLIFDSRQKLKGYWMPYIQHAVPLLEVFNPRRRLEVLPQFNRRYLLRTARNLAAALSALHRSGYVAGDINESNVLVTPAALVTLIDTDSFQVREERDGRSIMYPCPVGKPEYTPPELQNHALAEVIRLPDHDGFGLAVLIFQLLMEGSHPFRAQWLAAGDPPPLEARIANGAYPYIQSPAYPVLPPKNALGIETLHPWLVELFYRCFVDGHRDPRWRPGPDLWVRALTEAEKALVCCAQGHYYSSHLSDCPYCAISLNRATASKQTTANKWSAAAAAHKPAPQKATSYPSAGQTTRSPFTTQANRAASPFTQPVAAAPAGATARPAQAARPPQAAPANRPNSASNPRAFFNPFGGWPVASVTSSGSATMPTAANRSTASTGGASSVSAIFGIPNAVTRGVLRSRPLMQPGAVGRWMRQRTYKSLVVGGLQGALAGALPGLAIGLYNWFSGSILAWPILFAVGGVLGGLLRGWTPGHKLAGVIDRYVGWKLFWQGLGLVAGTVIGGALGLMFIWAVIPIFLGLFLGARGGLYLGGKIWQLGNNFGWERIWGAVSGLGFGALGYGVAQLIGLAGINAFGDNLAAGLLPFANNGSFTWAVIWMMAGAAGGALSGALAGLLTDLMGRLSGLVN
ncbi:MAG TPA: hypothetical protein VF806_05700 [Anaerolineaceae bacterium]